MRTWNLCFCLDYRAWRKASHLAGWPPACPGDGLQLWHQATVVKGRGQLEQDQLVMYHLSIPNGREPREHVQELTKKKGSIAAADIEVGGFANKVPLLFPQKKELKLVFKIKILRKDSSYSFFFLSSKSLLPNVWRELQVYTSHLFVRTCPLKQIMEMQSLRYEAADVSVSLSGCGCYLDPSSGNNKRTLCSACLAPKGLPGREEEAGGEQKSKDKRDAKE